MRLLIEGIASAPLPCSLTLLVPALAVALAARTESTAGLLGFGATAVGYSWLRFADRTEPLPSLTIAGLVAAGAIVLVLPVVRRLDVVSALGGVLVGIGAAALWEPCVGAEFGHLLDRLPSRGAVGFLLFAAYALGVLSPIVAIGVALHLLPDGITLPIRPAMLAVGTGALALLAFTVAIGQHDQVLGQLSRLST
ncbi:MAG: hypothetical protein R2733_14900 [Acidimicrobiales bacterium]